MIKLLQILISGILTSLYFFPLELWAYPGMNSKKVMAVLGLALFVLDLIKTRKFNVNYRFLGLIGFAFAVSVFSLLSSAYNQTPDTSYADYIISFAVWLGGAYVVCHGIKWTHGKVDVPLIVKYLTGVCVFQCVSALVIDSVPAIQQWVDQFFNIEQTLMHTTKRLYGLSAHLDVAGARFSAVLVAIAFLIVDDKDLSALGRSILFVSFLFISVVGNMIARTAIVGVVLGAGYFFIRLLPASKTGSDEQRRSTIGASISILIIGIIVCVFLYKTDLKSRQLFRFAFEGFFSLVETGHWQTGSTNTLQTMVVFPENLRTWIIGDGYFENSRSDPNYLGNATDMGYYMGTDVGYLRFIFYFGVPGLLCMMGVIAQSAYICGKEFPKDRMIFLLALLVGLIVWIKVSTDIFCFFAPFLCAAALKDTDYA